MLHDCPECALPCTVEPRGSVTSTRGPLELAAVDCVAGHRFLMPADAFWTAPAASVPRRPRRDRPPGLG
jgi:hypothetical protein